MQLTSTLQVNATANVNKINVANSSTSLIPSSSYINQNRVYQNNSNLTGTLLSNITPLLGAFGIVTTSILGFSRSITGLTNIFRQMVEPTDNLIAAINRIKVGTNQDYSNNTITRKLLRYSNDAFTDIDTLTQFASKLTFIRDDIDFDTAGRLASTVSKANYLGGATTSEINSILLQLSQGLASNKLSGDELRAIREAGPALLRYMVQGMNQLAIKEPTQYGEFKGVTVGNIKDLGSAGKLTSDVVINSLLEVADKVDKDFDKTQKTTTQMLTNIANNVLMATFNNGSIKSLEAINSTIQDIYRFTTQNNGDDLKEVIYNISDLLNFGISTLVTNLKTITSLLNNITSNPIGNGIIKSLISYNLFNSMLRQPGLNIAQMGTNAIGRLFGLQFDSTTQKYYYPSRTLRNNNLTSDILNTPVNYKMTDGKKVQTYYLKIDKSSMTQPAKEYYKQIQNMSSNLSPTPVRMSSKETKNAVTYILKYDKTNNNNQLKQATQSNQTQSKILTTVSTGITGVKNGVVSLFNGVQTGLSILSVISQVVGIASSIYTVIKEIKLKNYENLAGFGNSSYDTKKALISLNRIKTIKSDGILTTTIHSPDEGTATAVAKSLYPRSIILNIKESPRASDTAYSRTYEITSKLNQTTIPIEQLKGIVSAGGNILNDDLKNLITKNYDTLKDDTTFNKALKLSTGLTTTQLMDYAQKNQNGEDTTAYDSMLKNSNVSRLEKIYNEATTNGLSKVTLGTSAIQSANDVIESIKLIGNSMLKANEDAELAEKQNQYLSKLLKNTNDISGSSSETAKNTSRTNYNRQIIDFLADSGATTFYRKATLRSSQIGVNSITINVQTTKSIDDPAVAQQLANNLTQQLEQGLKVAMQNDVTLQ